MDTPQDTQMASTIQDILNKMAQSSISSIHPPFFPKTLTKFRQQHYQLLKKHLKLYLSFEELKKIDDIQMMKIVKTIQKFITQFDDKYFPDYLQTLRQPYIRKMFQQNYGFDDVDFKVANQQFKLKRQIQNTLNEASQWLIQVQYTQDILNRIHLYFGIKTPVVLQKIKKEGVENAKQTWFEIFKSGFRSITSFTLRKTSKMVQSNVLTALAPAAAMVSFAILGKTTNFPLKSDLNMTAFIPSLVVMVVPFVLDSMAQCIEKNQMYSILQKWTINFEKMSTAIRKYNQFLQNAIKNCIQAESPLQFHIEYTNLQKYIFQLTKNLKSIEDQSEDKIQQIRQRTQAYFRQYVELKQGQWTVVIAKDQYEKTKPNQ